MQVQSMTDAGKDGYESMEQVRASGVDASQREATRLPLPS